MILNLTLRTSRPRGWLPIRLSITYMLIKHSSPASPPPRHKPWGNNLHADSLKHKWITMLEFLDSWLETQAEARRKTNNTSLVPSHSVWNSISNRCLQVITDRTLVNGLPYLTILRMTSTTVTLVKMMRKSQWLDVISKSLTLSWTSQPLLLLQFWKHHHQLL